MDYNEKLRLAKEALDSGSYDKETIEYIFPELAESEDERIRRDIISYIQVANQVIPQFQKDNWIAWLEKQGGPKLAESEDESIREAQLDYWRSVGGKEWHGVPVQETITWLEKQKSVEWRKEDGMIFDELYDFLINKKVVLQRDCNIYAHWLKSLKQRMEE